MVRTAEPLPRYYQVERALRERIEAGEWSVGDLFPPERELVALYGISRMTVRQALSGLVADGLLHRQRGRGTFVAPAKLHKQPSSLLSFTEDVTRRGKRAAARVLQARFASLPPVAVGSLDVEVGRAGVVIERLRLVNDEPIGIERSHLAFDGCQGILEADLSSSLYTVLREEFGLVPVRAAESIEAGACSKRAAEVLGVQPGAPVLLITRTTYGSNGRPFEFVQSTYRCDRYVFHVNLTPQAEFSEDREAAFGFSS
jgi:GntR family transcriptional regulator